MEFFDRVTATNARKTDDGYLVADAPVARTGVQLYRGSELGKPEIPFIRLYRPESEVFAADAMHSYAHRPMTNDHPTVLVDADNWKELAIGQTGDEVVRDGATVRVPLVLMDASAIADFEKGKCELSMGYTAEIEFLDSEQVTDDGLEYDAIQKNMRMNHLALVQKGRAGNTRIGDTRDPHNAREKTGGHHMPDLKTVVVDGLTIETTTQGAQVIEKLQATIATHDAAVATQSTAHSDAVALLDTELAKRDAEITALKDAALSDAEMSAAVAARSELVATAKQLHDADYSSLDASEIRKAVVVASLGDEAVAGKSDAYIDARFDVLAESLGEQKVDPVRAAIGDAEKVVPIMDADAAHDQYVTDITNAYKA